MQTAQTLPHHLTKIDTLQDQVKHLKHVVDSLNGVSNSNTIYTGMFHDMVNSQVVTYSCIVAVIAAAVVGYSWNRFREILAQRVNDLARSEELFSSFSTEINAKVSDVTNSFESMQRQNLRQIARVYFLISEVIRASRFEESMLWRLRGIEAFSQNKGNVSVIDNLVSTVQLIEKGTLDKIVVGKFSSQFFLVINKIRNNKIEAQEVDIDDLLHRIEKKIRDTLNS